MPVALPPLHDDLSFNAPLGQDRADQLVEFLATTGRGRVVDVGCGWGELLLRTITAAAGLTGLGIDRKTNAVVHGRAGAEARGLGARV